MFQVLKMGNDRIREMAEYRSVGEAAKAAKRFAAEAGD
jgi:hypothetical protein